MQMLRDQSLENYSRAALMREMSAHTITRFHRDYIVTLAEHYAFICYICSIHRRSLAQTEAPASNVKNLYLLTRIYAYIRIIPLPFAVINKQWRCNIFCSLTCEQEQESYTK